METPWVDRAPLEIVRSNIRFSLQPVDAPPEPETLNRLFDHMQSDELILFSTDYPHWQFDGDEVLPEGLSPDLVRKIMIDNPHGNLRPPDPVRDEGDDAMNVQLRDRPEPASTAQIKTAIADCDIHPARATQGRTVSAARQTLAFASRNLWRACLSGHDGRPALSEGAAERVAPRCLSAGRRAAGLVAVVHAKAASRSQQCRARRAQSARRHRAGPAQSRSRRGARDRHQRLADRKMDQQGQAPERLGRRRQ